MRPRSSPPPLWFVVCAAVALAWLCRYLVAGTPDAAPAGGHAPDIRYAFWFWVIPVVTWIWNGIQAAARVTLEILKWMVINLSAGVARLGNGLKEIGSALLTAGRATWKFFELTYERVLKPAWLKFWRWFDKTRTWLDHTFGPTLRWLRRLRDNLLKFWKTYVRQWLDIIDATRRVLRVLSSLGLRWAAALDKRLGDLEARIERPFRLLLAKVNEVINLVNRVVTLDGLFQRVALIRSMVRDAKFTTNIWWHTVHGPADPAAVRRLTDPPDVKTTAQNAAEYKALLRGDAGHQSVVLEEHVLDFRLLLRSLSR
jgi:hypothetical protein